MEEFNIGFIKSHGFELISVTKNKAVLKSIIGDNELNPIGIAHGGLLFGLADTAAGVLAFANNKKCVTTSANINYLKPATNKVIATATILKEGKNIGYYNVEIRNELNELVAISTVNMYFK